MSLGTRIHEARKARGLSQEALGETLGVVSQTVSKWERGESSPDAALLPALADALGVSLDSLFDRVPTDEEMEERFLRWLRPKTEEARTDGLLRLQRRQMELDLGMLEEAVVIPPLPEKVRYAWLGKRCLSLYRSSPESPASFIFREPEGGWDKLFEEPDLLGPVWEALGNREVLHAARKILSSPANGIVAKEALGKLLDLTEPERSIPLLERLKLLWLQKRTVDGEERELCFFTPDCDVLALLTMGNLLYGRALPEMVVSGGGWSFRPPLYDGSALYGGALSLDPALWRLPMTPDLL